MDSRYHFQIQVYIDAAHFVLKTITTPTPIQSPPLGLERAKEPYYLNRYFPGGILGKVPVSGKGLLILICLIVVIFIVIPLFIMTRKHLSILRAQAGIKYINWNGTEWIPPKLHVGNFRQKGKIAQNLTALEAAMLLEMPLATILSMMLSNMERKIILKLKK